MAATRAIMLSLGERLTDDERIRLGAVLPSSMAKALRGARYRGDFDLAELVDRVHRRENVNIGFAREHVQVVCQAVGECLTEELRVLLERTLPPSFAELFRGSPPSVEGSEEQPAAGVKPGRTLATGRPGARHPLSASAPPGAQTHSVVREKNPHGETKLSSSSGMTQERMQTALSTARSEGRRTIANAKE